MLLSRGHRPREACHEHGKCGPFCGVCQESTFPRCRFRSLSFDELMKGNQANRRRGGPNADACYRMAIPAEADEAGRPLHAHRTPASWRNALRPDSSLLPQRSMERAATDADGLPALRPVPRSAGPARGARSGFAPGRFPSFRGSHWLALLASTSNDFPGLCRSLLGQGLSEERTVALERSPARPIRVQLKHLETARRDLVDDNPRCDPEAASIRKEEQRWTRARARRSPN